MGGTYSHWGCAIEGHNSEYVNMLINNEKNTSN